MVSESIISWWIGLVRRRWLAGVLIFAVPFAFGMFTLYRSRPVYRAEARVRLGDPPPMGGVSPNASVLGLLRMGGDPFANDLELFASRTVAEGVVEDVALGVRLAAPRGWHRDSFFVALRADRSTEKRSYTLVWRDGGVDVSTATGAVSRITPGVPASLGGMVVTARPWRDPMPRSVVLSTVPFGEAVRTTQAKLKFSRARRDANVVLLNYQTTDPAVARAVVNSALARFVDLRTSLVRRESGITVDSVRGVALRTRAELVTAEQALEQVQRATGLIAPEAQGELAVERFADVSARLELARLELRTLTAARERASSDDAASAWTSLLAYPRFLANDAMAELVGGLNELEIQRRELSRRRTADNVELQVVLDRIRYLDASLRTLAGDYAASLEGEIASLDVQERRMHAEFAAMPGHMLELVRRQREARVLGEIVVLAEQRLRQEELRQALTFANVQVIDPPALRYRPVWPRRKLGTLVTLMLAGGTALIGMVIVDRADNTVRSARALRERMGATVLAALVVGRSGAPAPDAEAARAILRAGVVEPNGIVRLVIADCSDGRTARIVEAAVRAGAAAGGALMPKPVIEIMPSIHDYTAASAIAASRVPVLLAVEAGRTDMSAADRAAELLREAGAQTAGVVVVCRNHRAARSLWQ